MAVLLAAGLLSLLVAVLLVTADTGPAPGGPDGSVVLPGTPGRTPPADGAPTCGPAAADPLCVAWSAPLGPPPETGVRALVEGRRVALAEPGGVVTVRTRRDGAVAWRTALEPPVGLRALSDGVLYATSDAGLTAVRDGRAEWTLDLPPDLDPLSGPSALVRWVGVAADRVYVLAGSELLAVDRASGALVWRWSRQHALSAGLTGAGPYVVVVDGVVGVAPADGGRRWRVDMVTFDNRPHRVAGGVVVIADDQGAVHGLDAGAGRRSWRHRVPRGGLVRALTVTGDVVVGETDHGLVALSAADGAERWRLPVGRDASVLAAPGGTVVVASPDDGSVRGLDRETGTPRWRRDGLRPTAAASVAGSLLLAEGPVVRRLDPTTGAGRGSIDLRAPVRTVTAGGTAVVSTDDRAAGLRVPQG